MKMKMKSVYLLGLMVGGWIYGASAAVPASVAQQLGTTLTQFGAQKEGTPDGAVPPYTGGIAAMANLPAGGATSGYPDPFANEKPLFSITASNMTKYAGQLTPGTQAILQRYPEYHIDVYTTHRTASYPSWVLANTIKNATSAQMVGDGDGVSGASGGIPFPIPQDGNEVMWNSFLQYVPSYCTETYQSYLVDSSGGVTDLGTIFDKSALPYYDPNTALSSDKFYRYFELLYYSPVQEAGNLILFDYTKNYQISDNVVWSYSPGTRRVRLAPEFKYDTPIATFGGAMDFDEVDMFYGQMDKFDFKLVGKKEMIVPYNDYIFGTHVPESSILGTHVINPNGIRWERHRVWVVDATLKPGERHSYSRWTFYIDEDSWKILATESYDHSGAIYRVGLGYPYQNYSEYPATELSYTYSIYDLSKGTYMLARIHTADNGYIHCIPNMPSVTQFTPQAMAQEAIR
jgi:hypothetical protein